MTAKFFGGVWGYESMSDNHLFNFRSAQRLTNRIHPHPSRNCPFKNKLELDGGQRQISYQPFGAVSVLRGGPYV